MLAVARAALAAYELAPVTELRPISRANNAVFEVVAGLRFALRVHRPSFRAVAHTRSELQFVEALHGHLQGTNVEVPRPVRARDGSLVVDVEGRHCDLLTWVDGRVLRPTRGLGPQGAWELGRALGRIHRFAEQFEPTAGFELPRWDAEGMFTAASPFGAGDLSQLMLPEDSRLFADVADRTRAVFECLDEDEGSRGVVHFDFILLNCHLVRRPQGWRVGVIDFDDLGWGYFLYDLCPLLGNLADFAGYARLSRAFLAGYRSIRALPTAHEAHLPLLMAARHAVACVWIAGLEQGFSDGPPAREHIAYRMDAARRCLELAAV